MRHNVTLEGYGIRLRPVTLDDAEFIVKLRNMPHALGNIGDSAQTAEDQKKWLNSYFERDNDYYFIIESPSQKQIGTVGIYNIDFDRKTAESGRFVALPASFSVLSASILIQDFSFDTLNLNKLETYVVSSNVKVISYNKRLGYQFISTLHADRKIASSMKNMVYLELTRTRWSEVREKLVSILEAPAVKRCLNKRQLQI